MIQTFTRKQLFNMSTKNLYDLLGEIATLEEKVRSELILRGDY